MSILYTDPRVSTIGNQQAGRRREMGPIIRELCGRGTGSGLVWEMELRNIG